MSIYFHYSVWLNSEQYRQQVRSFPLKLISDVIK